jgi:hypothetical protein
MDKDTSPALFSFVHWSKMTRDARFCVVLHKYSSESDDSEDPPPLAMASNSISVVVSSTAAAGGRPFKKPRNSRAGLRLDSG